MSRNTKPSPLKKSVSRKETASRLNGLSYRQIRHVVDKVIGEDKISEATIRTHMGCAQSGERGPAAGLTDEQTKELTDLLADFSDDKGDE